MKKVILDFKLESPSYAFFFPRQLPDLRQKPKKKFRAICRGDDNL